MKHRGAWLVVIMAVLLAAMANLRELSAPPPLRTVNAADQFNAVRSKARLARILGDERPHPSDSDANDLVRARLIAELQAIGLRPRIDARFTCNSKAAGSSIECGRVRNVLASIGPERGEHLLVVSHYDSVPVGPGAGDDGIGVGSMLEVAALMKDRPLARPITFLFNEGEELGLLGARAFLDGDPLRDRVDALLNVEARGVRGPVSMFETSTPNSAVIQLYAQVVDQPSANSLAVSAYRRLPNSTDVNTFAEKKWLVLNFAPTGNETRYHSAGDNLAALSPATLQHMGDQLLGMTGALGAAPTPPQASGETLFMDLLGREMLTLPLWLGWLLLSALIVVFAIASWRRRALTGVPLLAGAAVGGVALAWLGVSIVGTIRDGQFWRAHQPWSEVAIYAGVIATALLLLGYVRRLEVGQWRSAFWLLFTALAVPIGSVASGGLIYFLVPPAIAALGMLAQRWWRPAETVGALVAAAFLFLTMGAMLGMLGELFNSGPLWMLAIVGALVLLPWLVEAQPLAKGLPPQTLIGGALALPLVGWTTAAALPATSADRQQQFSIEHVTNRSTGRTSWAIANDGGPLPTAFDRMATWRLDKVPYSARMRWQAPAAAADSPRGAARVIGQVGESGKRRIRLQLERGGADTLTLLLPASARIEAAGLPGRQRPLKPPKTGNYSIFCGGRGCEGAVIEVVTGSAKPVTATLVSRRFGLPTVAGPLLSAKPLHARPQYVPDSTVSLERLRL